MKSNALLLVLATLMVLPSRAQGEEPVLDRSQLLIPDSSKQDLKDAGINLGLAFTQFYQGTVAGEGDRTWQYGGKGDLIVGIDGEKVGLWSGFSVSIHGELEYGDDANSSGSGVLLPVDTGMGLPRFGGTDEYASVVLTQAIAEGVTVSVGNFNMVDTAAQTPLIGNGDANGSFLNVGLTAPVSGITPPYILGANLVIRTAPAVYAFYVYDPRNAESWEVFEHPFSEGVTGLASVTVPIEIGGLSGYQGVKLAYSTQDGFDLDNVPGLGLPPESQGFSPKSNRWYAAYSFQQYLQQNPDNPREGWGVFGEVGISDANPNVIAWHAIAGIGGTSFVPGRSDDRFGIAYFRYGLSDKLRDGLEDFGIDLQDESGVEAYYNAALTPWFRLSADIQVIDPVSRNDMAVFVGVRGQLIVF